MQAAPQRSVVEGRYICQALPQLLEDRDRVVKDGQRLELGH